MIQQLVEQNYPKASTLNDGTPITIRPMGPTDRHLLWSFFQKIPEQDRMYFKHDVAMQKTIDSWCTNIDYDKTLPLLALKGDAIIADATLHVDAGGWLSHIGMIRIVTGPDYRGKGIGNRLIQELIDVATLCKLDQLEADFMAEQQRSIESFEKLGFKRAYVMPHRVRDRKMQYHDLVVLTYDLTRKREEIGAG